MRIVKYKMILSCRCPLELLIMSSCSTTNMSFQVRIQFYLVALGELSEFKGQALNYISGFIQKKIYEKEQCINCKLYIANLRIVNSSALLNIKNRGGLTKPSPAIERIVRVSETVFSDMIKDGKTSFRKKTLLDKIIIKVNQQS